jgi:hypothetical protein
MEPMKWCSKCNQLKRLIEFGRSNRLKCGYVSRCKQCANTYYAVYREEYRLLRREYCRLYYQEHSEKQKLSTKRYRSKHKERRREYERNYAREKRRKDEDYRIKDNLRRRINNVLHGAEKCAGTVELLGCGIKIFRIWFEFKYDTRNELG